LIAALACRLCGFVKRKQFERGYKIIMKKNIVKIAAALFFAALVAGVAIAAPAKKNASSGTVKIVTDIFPVYDWVREITKNSAAKIKTQSVCMPSLYRSIACLARFSALYFTKRNEGGL